jgi:hypothetical protein
VYSRIKIKSSSQVNFLAYYGSTNQSTFTKFWNLKTFSLHYGTIRAKWKTALKCPYRPDAIWQRDANFQFSMTFNFNIFLCFSNIRNHISNFSYLVWISSVVESRWAVSMYGPYYCKVQTDTFSWRLLLGWFWKLSLWMLSFHSPN